LNSEGGCDLAKAIGFVAHWWPPRAQHRRLGERGEKVGMTVLPLPPQGFDLFDFVELILSSFTSDIFAWFTANSLSAIPPPPPLEEFGLGQHGLVGARHNCGASLGHDLSKKRGRDFFLKRQFFPRFRCLCERKKMVVCQSIIFCVFCCKKSDKMLKNLNKLDFCGRNSSKSGQINLPKKIPLVIKIDTVL